MKLLAFLLLMWFPAPLIGLKSQSGLELCLWLFIWAAVFIFAVITLDIKI